MKNLCVITVFVSMLSFGATAQEWGTVFPTIKELAEMDRIYSGKKIIVQNHYYPKTGKFAEVLALRIAAVTFQSEYESLEVLNKEIKSFTPEQKIRFDREILDKMKLLINRFKRTSSYVVFE